MDCVPLHVPGTDEFIAESLYFRRFSGTAVYILQGEDGSPQYIGQSSQAAQRLSTHRSERRIPFHTAVLYYVPDLVSRLRIEGILILTHLPPYNRGLNLGLHDGRVWEARWPGRKSRRTGRRGT